MPVGKKSGVGFLTAGSYLVFKIMNSGFVPRVSCLIASSLSIIKNSFCGPFWGLLFFYSSCLLHESWTIMKLSIKGLILLNPGVGEDF